MPDTYPKTKLNAAAEWSSWFTCFVISLLLYETVTGCTIYFLPFSVFNQYSVLLHTCIGILSMVPVGWYCYQHWLVRKDGNFNHYQLLGYGSFLFLVVCIISGIVVTVQAVFGNRISILWDLTHILSGLLFFALILIHIFILVFRKTKTLPYQQELHHAKRLFYRRSVTGCFIFLVISMGLVYLYPHTQWEHSFVSDYNWRFGKDRPFAPSLAQLDYQLWENQVLDSLLNSIPSTKQNEFLAAYNVNAKDRQGFIKRIEQSLADISAPDDMLEKLQPVISEYTNLIQERGAINPNLLAGSSRCGTSGCHEQIYQEWLPSAHRYSSLDHLFQRTQELMAEETSPEQTRYCAGCHDPISLFGGAKNQSNITLGVEGADEGSSCVVCHSIIQTDTQGNADYILKPPTPYLFEKDNNSLAVSLSNFLIRAYPRHHVESYSRPLYKSPEYCGACHKQYIDKEVNTDIGRVQGQNQYDSWRKSRWFDENHPEQSITCRECHMPLQQSNDPASGDPSDFNRHRQDQQHRSHQFLASNQYIPMYHQLPNAEQHTHLTEKWLRGEIEVPEIADRWTTGPVVTIEIRSPAKAKPGTTIPIQVILVNNKTGHDFPTGPLDMIESWLELSVSDSGGEILYHAGILDNGDNVLDSPLIFKSDGFDRKGDLIDRHNLWDLVGAKYKRSMFPGFTDTVHVNVFCPDNALSETTRSPQRSGSFEIPISNQIQPGSITVKAMLWYRKANAAFLKRIYGIDTELRAPITELSKTEAKIQIDA